MPITKVANVITYTAPLAGDIAAQTGVMRADQFAFCDKLDETKQIAFDASSQTANTTVTISSGAQTTSATFTLPTTGTSLVSLGSQPPNAIGNSGTTKTVNWATSLNASVTLSANCTFTFSNPVSGEVHLLVVTQGTGGSKLATWPTVKWVGGAAPTLTTAQGAIDIVTFYYDGTNYYGNIGLAYA